MSAWMQVAIPIGTFVIGWLMHSPLDRKLLAFKAELKNNAFVAYAKLTQIKAKVDAGVSSDLDKVRNLLRNYF